jgi:hypothetical protein
MRKVLLSVVWSLAAAALAQGALIQGEFAPTSALPAISLSDDRVDADGVLCIHLLDSVSPSSETCSNTTGDNWLAGQALLLAAGSDPNPSSDATVNWSCLFTPQGLNTLRSYVGGELGSGLGLDSQFRNTGVDSTIMRHMLEPAPLLIGGLAVTPLLYGKRR